MEVRLYQNLLEFNWNLLFSAITVLVLFIILKHFFFEKVLLIMETRKAMITEELENADAECKRAEKLLEEYSKTLAGAEEEKREILREAKVFADEHAAQIISDAKGQAAIIMAETQKKIVAEEEKAARRLKKEIASLAILTAGQIMEKELQDGGQEELVNKVLEEAAEGKWQNL